MTAPARFSDDPDLSWTAFRYVAGELPPALAAAFEARLGVDQNAREAVAAAVELSSAVALLDSSETVPLRPRGRSLRAAGWVAAGIAAGLLLGFGFDRLVLHPPRAAWPLVAEEVVYAWSDLRQRADDPDALAHQLALNDDTADLAATLTLESSSDGELPSWMAVLASLPSPDTTPRAEN